MKLIYWNTKHTDQINPFLSICRNESPDVLFVSETYVEFIEENTKEFDSFGYSLIPNPGCERVIIIAKNNLEIELGLQSKYYTNIYVNGIQIISVHFPSQMNHHLDALRNHLLNFRTKINSEIGNSSETPILIIGDLNVNPYEAPMINFDGFMATNSPKGRTSIKNIDDRRETYYNPTWQLYGDNIFPGTKKFPRPSGSSFDIIEFHFLDQVLLSQKLKINLDKEQISVIKELREIQFFNTRYNRVEISDHLPLKYEFKLKEYELAKV